MSIQLPERLLGRNLRLQDLSKSYLLVVAEGVDLVDEASLVQYDLLEQVGEVEEDLRQLSQHQPLMQQKRSL